MQQRGHVHDRVGAGPWRGERREILDVAGDVLMGGCKVRGAGGVRDRVRIRQPSARNARITAGPSAPVAPVIRTVRPGDGSFIGPSAAAPVGRAFQRRDISRKHGVLPEMGLEILPSALPHPRTLLRIHARHIGERLRETIGIVGRHDDPGLGSRDDLGSRARTGQHDRFACGEIGDGLCRNRKVGDGRSAELNEERVRGREVSRHGSRRLALDEPDPVGELELDHSCFSLGRSHAVANQRDQDAGVMWQALRRVHDLSRPCRTPMLPANMTTNRPCHFSCERTESRSAGAM